MTGSIQTVFSNPISRAVWKSDTWNSIAAYESVWPPVILMTALVSSDLLLVSPARALAVRTVWTV